MRVTAFMVYVIMKKMGFRGNTTMTKLINPVASPVESC